MSTIVGLSPRKDGRDLPGARPGRDLRRAREARVKYWRIVTVSAFFVLLLGGGLLVGAVLIVKSLHTAAGETAASRRMGRMTFPLFDGVFCRHVLIDNETAQTKEEKISRCDDRAVRSKRSKRDTSAFSWGGR
jgi:hypothetical protein